MADIPERSFEVVEESGAETISLLQFNALADALSDAFPHISDKQLVLDWQHRESRLHAVLTQHEHDFLCVEEVDHFGDSFLPFLWPRGYDGTFAMRRMVYAEPIKSRDGVALFWRRNKFKLMHKKELRRGGKCFGLVCYFVRADDTPLTVAVLHLTAKPGREHDRQVEVDILLKYLGEDSPVLIGGDFNDTPDSLACKQMRDAGFTSAYDHADDSWTTWKKRATEVKRVIDYIWHRGDVRTVARLSIPPSETFPRMLPDVHYPSDHIAIGAKMSVN